MGWKCGLITMIVVLSILLPVGIASAAEGWDYYKDITIDHTKVGGDQLNNFPVLISIGSDPDLIAAQEDGDDIVFTNQANTHRFNHQLERYIESSGSATMDAMVMIPTLSGTTDTIIRMWYGNGTCTSQQNPEAVWDSNFMAVFHLNETSRGGGSYDDFYDSTGNNNDGELGSAPQMNPDADGKIDGAVDFEGTGESYVQVASSPSLNITGSFTLETWVKLDEFTVGGKQVSVLVCKRDNDTTGYCMGITQNKDITMIVGAGGAYTTNGPDLTLGTWYHIVSTYEHTNSGTVNIYINGNPVLTGYTTGNLAPTTRPLRIGACSFSAPCSFQVNGIIDEVRISNIARSPEWIATSYANQNNASGFYSIGAQNDAGPQQPVPELMTVILVSMGLIVAIGILVLKSRRRGTPTFSCVSAV